VQVAVGPGTLWPSRPAASSGPGVER